ncbi:MAG TPA: bifunctional UDP-N-acetylglucosamine diphosphorylase/glucosamine-1-phosphate N-acetyltransferase GlmU [Alcanivoracaceae bacterium]|nr:bifunctional UDP-N-acetylglucosamine diphosphorylase/glucosamine-1-phosphate N-acetyltransferase GlmU [Alcanivoracaceae bacterium]
MNVAAVILAAGKGTRMRSKLPKVLHGIAGRSMLTHVAGTAQSINVAQTIVVYGHAGDVVRDHMSDWQLQWAEQAEQLGTGHAVAQAMPEVKADNVLVLYGDVPLIQPNTLLELLELVNDKQMALLTLTMEDPQGYGRIIRNEQGEVQAIVEQKDATEAQLAINEINTGILACRRELLEKVLPQLSNSNAQGEYYLTDVISLAVENGITVAAHQPSQPWEVDGVNDRTQLARLERIYQKNMATTLMQQGATVLDPARLDVRGNVVVGQDVTLDVGVVLEGEVTLGENVVIGPHCVIKNSTIGANTVVEAHSIIEDSVVGEACNIGPFARLRPGTQLSEKVKVGNFVETKAAIVGKASKINHLSYVGDARLGADVNVGAGTITCNYDGANKHLTTIEDNAFIGSNTSLVAPVTVGANATVGAGSVITADVQPNELALTRAKQRAITGWERPTKKSK